MSNLVTRIVSERADFSSDVKNALNAKNIDCFLHADLSSLANSLEENPESCTSVIIDVCDSADQIESELRKLKRNEFAKHLPVIGITQKGDANPALCRRLFFHVLPAPINEEILGHTLEAAQTDYKRYQALMHEVSSRTSAIGLIRSGQFSLQTLQQAEALTTMLSLACPEPAVVALGLSELLVNAIEHGNLSISYKEKSNLLEKGLWDKEIQKRLQADDYKNRFVEILYERDETQIVFTITDQGNGFDWKKYIGNDPMNLHSKHGRGIAIAIAMGFDSLSYNDKGNSVTAVIKLSDERS